MPTLIDPQEYGDNVEILDDGSALIGEEEDSFADETSGLREHDENLASTVPDELLTEISQIVRENYDSDVEARASWMNKYKDGLASLLGEDSEEESSRTSRNMSEVTHPLIAEAATQFQARAIAELFPSSGPVGTITVGLSDQEKRDQALRVGGFMNYQLTEEMEEYYPDLDQMLFHLPLVGHAFKKSWYDVNLDRITSRFIRAEDLVVDSNAVTLATAERYTHLIRVPRHEFEEYVDNDFYLETTSGGAEISVSEDKSLEGVSPDTLDDRGPIELLEQHMYHRLPGDPRQLPYIVTMNSHNDHIVALRRNWDPEDETYKKQVWFTSYKFLPGLGFYGYGLYHMIGSLGKAATGALRSLLDAAAFSNMQGGLKLRGRVRGGEITIAPGEFADVDAAVDDINKAIMPLPFKEPSQTMMALLQFVVETGKKFANTADMNISDANQNTPVGTTVALLEEGTRVFSGIHKRLHNSQKHEFRLIAKLNGMHLPFRYPYRLKGEENFVLRSDFDNRVDVIPVSDPNTFSSTQRISLAQAGLQLAQSAPQLHNQFLAHQRMYEAMRYPGWEEILIDPSDIERMDAVTENVALMNGKPIKVFEDQDHMAHMQVLDDWFKRLEPQAAQLYIQKYAGHRAEHMALYYRIQIQQQLQAPLPDLLDFKDPSAAKIDVTPDIDKKVSQAAAVVVNQQPQAPMGPPIPLPPGQAAQQAAQDPMAAAKMLAEAEALSIQAKTQADIQAKQAKAQSDIQVAQQKAQAELQVARERMQAEMQMEQQKAQLTMQLKMIEIQAKSQEAAMREAAKSETDLAKLDAEIQAMWTRMQAEMEIAREKAQMEMQKDAMEQHRKEDAHQHEMHFKREAADSDDGGI